MSSSLPTERWLKIPGFEEYEASDFGNLRRASSRRVLKAFLNNRGYLRMSLRKNGKSYYVLLHRMVLTVFAGVPQDDTWQVNHKNGNKRDNRVQNLEWVTQSENMQHAAMNGLTPHKLTADQLRYIRKSRKSAIELGEIFGVSRQTISYARRGRRWIQSGKTRKCHTLK